MTRLGAILAGGKSRRFGSDKALALVDGAPLLEQVRAALAPQVDALIVVGRDWPGVASIADRPQPDQGPLGGLCAALHHAQAHGFDAVLTAGCDTLPVPDDLLALLDGDNAAILDDQPLFGLWPATLAPMLDDWLASQPRRSMHAWADRCGARRIATDIPFSNLNTQEELAAYRQARGLAA